MALLQMVEPGPVTDSNQLRSSSAREGASMPEESYDMASPFRGRKSRPRADCCNTTPPRATDTRRDLHLLLWTAIRIARERFAPPRAAGGRFPRSAERRALPA